MAGLAALWVNSGVEMRCVVLIVHGSGLPKNAICQASVSLAAPQRKPDKRCCCGRR
jgi:hypothetical protein